MIITSCGNSVKLAKELARKLKATSFPATYSPLTISSFPDGDLYLKYNTAVKGKTVVIVHSFQPHPNDSFLRVVFAAETAQDLGAKKVILVVPYLAYIRQDKRFHPGEAVSSKIVGKHLSRCVDKVISVDPHLHRYRSLKEMFSVPGEALTANDFMVKYLRRHFPGAVLVGPDWESSQWAGKIARIIGTESTIFEKTRYHSRKVRVKMVKPISLEGKLVVIVDDIISTGYTIIEAAKEAYRHGAREVVAIAVHGVFAEQAWPKLRKAGVKQIITANTIEHPTNKIDITPLLVEELRKEKT